MDRKGYIGGTDVAPICGLSKYKTPFSVWNEKVNGISNFEPTIESRVGLANENLAGELYTEETKVQLIKPTDSKTHKYYEWIKGHFDFIRKDDNNIVDAKTCTLHRAKEFGENLSDEMPVDYLLQIAWYAMIQDCEFSDLAVIIGNSQFKILRYVRRHDFEERIIKLCKFFWDEYVLKEIPPPPKNIEDTKLLWPVSYADKAAIATIEDIENFEKYVEIDEEIKELEEERNELKLKLIESIKDNETLITSDGQKLLTYKSSSSRSILDTKKLQSQYANIYNQCLKNSAGYRIFRPNLNREIES